MNLDKIFRYINCKEEFIQVLKEWVSIKSVSASPELRDECFRMVNIVSNEFKKIGCHTNIVDNPIAKQTLVDGSVIDLPPIIFASFGQDTSKKTVCIYGHIDVQPAEKSDGWDTEPFELVIDGDRMIGRGSSDDKGPVLGWLCVLKAFIGLGVTPGVNLKFVIECMEECGSEGLDELLKSERNKFLADIDYTCISDNYWLGTKKPCVTYGLRGIAYFFLEVSGPIRDLHSGVYGGTIYEPMTDLISLLNRLVDNRGNILIPKIYDKVRKCSQEELDLYADLDFSPSCYAEDINCTEHNLIYKSKIDILTHRWRYPTLSIHGIEGAFSKQGAKTVIPSKVIGKFSIRIVPDMDVEDVKSYVDKYITDIAQELNTPNKIRLCIGHSGPAWIADINNPNFVSASKATKRVYGVKPDMTREGGSIPITLTFQEITEKSVLLLPMGRGDDGAHSQNEKLNKSNFINGIKLFAAYLSELSQQ
ncbi:hypothetical protein HZS_885 [Henneguya salminicola]|nr:hypothetical protein HZS_885 [Henneguya salminicola]